MHSSADVTETRGKELLWRQALRDAAGFFAAFATPANFSVNAINVAGAESKQGEKSIRAIEQRLCLGRSMLLADLAEDLTASVTTQYRHQISVERGSIRGKLHVPRYSIFRSHGRLAEFPVVRTRRNLMTSENMLISEAIHVSIQTLRHWTSTSGAEATLARQTRSRLLRLQNGDPWAQLRAAPKPAMASLVSSVRSRVAGGAIHSSHPAAKIADLFDVAHSAQSFEMCAGALAFGATSDLRFADRLFELLCLSWFADAIQNRAAAVSVHWERVKRANGKPVLEAEIAGAAVKVFFQAASALPRPQWTYLRNGKRRRLRALPDIVITIQDQNGTRIWLVDAKNRSEASVSEIVYKMLGYRENLRIRPYLAVAVLPRYDGDAVQRVYRRKNSEVRVCSLPLSTGKVECAQLMDQFLGINDAVV